MIDVEKCLHIFVNPGARWFLGDVIVGCTIIQTTFKILIFRNIAKIRL